MTNDKNIAIVFAGGVGSRMDLENIPKQFLEVDNTPIIIHTLMNFEKNNKVDGIVVACLEPWIDYLNDKIIEFNLKKIKAVIPGGATGQDSIYNALIKAKEYAENDANVLIHDGVRPYLEQDLINRCIEQTNQLGSAITCTPCFETVIVSVDKKHIESVPYRKDTLAGQAPQCFKLNEIIAAHDDMRKINPDYENVIDSCTLYTMLGKNVELIEGHRGNIKITTPADYYQFKSLLEFDEAKKNGITVPISENVVEYMTRRR